GGSINGPGQVAQIGSGTTILTAVSNYSGSTVVNNGTLIVNGSIASSSGLDVNIGATVGGTGTLPTTRINDGGTLSPGNSIGTITVQGNLVFASAATYMVEVSPSAADRTNVTGTATLAGTVQAVFQPGSYSQRAYTIVSAGGGLNGTFGTLVTAGLPSGFLTTLSYTATDALLNLTANLAGAGGAAAPSAIGCGFSVNQCNVATAINNFFNNGGALPPAFVSLFGLTGSNLANALSQLSGEAATGAQKVAFQLTD